jgi:hypothetical protein
MVPVTDMPSTRERYTLTRSLPWSGHTRRTAAAISVRTRQLDLMSQTSIRPKFQIIVNFKKEVTTLRKDETWGVSKFSSWAESP